MRSAKLQVLSNEEMKLYSPDAYNNGRFAISLYDSTMIQFYGPSVPISDGEGDSHRTF